MRNLVVRSLLVIFCLLISIPNIAYSDGPSTRIVGGIDAEPGAWPFMVAIIDKGQGAYNGQFCGGSLITDKWVITAAHCLQEKTAAQIQVVADILTLSNDDGETINVAQIINHPQYNPSTNDNDIALIELSTASTRGTPVEVASGSETFAGFTATAIGWGLTDPNNEQSYGDRLQQVNLPVVTNAVCDSAYSGGITDRMVCAGFAEGGKDSCQGDSGGPLVVNDGGTTKLIGATSFGNGCAQPNAYGVYARVSELLDFVNTYVTLDTSCSGATSATDGKYALWNGFLGMTVIGELFNRTNDTIAAQVNISSIDGELQSSNIYNIPAQSKLDVIFNSLCGFKSNSYGLAQVSSNVEATLFFYRPTGGSGFSNFDFAFGTPFVPAQTEDSFVSFNTFDPSNSGQSISNWISIVNLHSSTQAFTTEKYGLNGNLLVSEPFAVESKKRTDRDGGHENPGPDNVGLIKVDSNGTDPYLAYMFRYGLNPATGNYNFGFPLIASNGYTGPVSVALGASIEGQNWLEVVDVSGSTNNLVADLYDNNGSLLQSVGFSIGGYAQHHIDVTSILGSKTALGRASVRSTNGKKFITQSMYYAHYTGTQNVASMYGLQGVEATTGTKQGDYNLFLGQRDYFRIMNPMVTDSTVDVTISSQSSTGSSTTVVVPANGQIELDLHDYSTYGTAENTYGIATAAPQNGSDTIHANIIRVRPDPANPSEVQYTAPTDLK